MIRQVLASRSKAVIGDCSMRYVSILSGRLAGSTSVQQHRRSFSTDNNGSAADDTSANVDLFNDLFANQNLNGDSNNLSTVCDDARLAMTVGMSEQQLQIVNLFEEDHDMPSQTLSNAHWTNDPRETLSSNLLAASYLYWRTGTSSSKYPITQKTSTGSAFVQTRER